MPLGIESGCRTNMTSSVRRRAPENAEERTAGSEQLVATGRVRSAKSQGDDMDAIGTVAARGWVIVALGILGQLTTESSFCSLIDISCCQDNEEQALLPGAPSTAVTKHPSCHSFTVPVIPRCSAIELMDSKAKFSIRDGVILKPDFELLHKSESPNLFAKVKTKENTGCFMHAIVQSLYVATWMIVLQLSSALQHCAFFT